MLLKLIKAISAGTLAYFLIGYAVFSLLLGNFTDRHTTVLVGFKKGDGLQEMAWVVASCLAYATLVSILLVYWQKEASITDGLLKGAIIGTLIACMTDFYWYGTSNFYNNLLPVFADIIAAMITVAVMSAVIVWAGRR